MIDYHFLAVFSFSIDEYLKVMPNKKNFVIFMNGLAVIIWLAHWSMTDARA
jgi:hypothetical protein